MGWQSLLPYTADITYFLIPLPHSGFGVLASFLSVCLAAQSWLALWGSCRSECLGWERGRACSPLEKGLASWETVAGRAQQRMQALGSHFLSPLWALAAPSRAFSLVTWRSVLDLGSGFLQSFRSTEHVSTELEGESMSWHVVGFSHKDEDVT